MGCFVPYGSAFIKAPRLALARRLLSGCSKRSKAAKYTRALIISSSTAACACDMPAVRETLEKRAGRVGCSFHDSRITELGELSVKLCLLKIELQREILLREGRFSGHQVRGHFDVSAAKKNGTRG